MIQKREGDFVLSYDAVSDTARLTHLNGLVARWEGQHCYVENAAGWLAALPYGGQEKKPIWANLAHWRALLGYDTHFLGKLRRLTALREWQQWDKLMKHGIWKCSNPKCEWCKGH